MEFYATCPASFEAALGDELRALGLARVRPLKGRVSFEGEPADAQRACLWSRLASRVYVVIGRFSCPDAEALYAGAHELPWEAIIVEDASIAMAVNGTNDALKNTHFSALRLKDAVCDRLAETRGARPNVDTEHPDARILLTLRGDRAAVALDLAGEPLFRRFPRSTMKHLAGPHAHVLRPDYAALALAQAGWSGASTPAFAHRDTGQAEGADGSAANRAAASAVLPLIDAGCAGGGVVLEAAQMLLDRAPGIERAHWGFTSWTRFDERAWNTLLDDAHARQRAAAKQRGTIIATDLDPAARGDAERLIAAAGFDRLVTFSEPDAAALVRASRSAGVRQSRRGGGTGIAASPEAPTGTGLIFADALDAAVSRMPLLLALIAGLRAARELEGFTCATLMPSDLLDRVIGTAPTARLELHADNERALLAVYPPAVAHRGALTDAGETPGSGNDDAAARNPAEPTTIDLGDGKPLLLLLPESEQFAHRLRKVARLRRKWAKREGASCYRVYDADLPDYAAAIDLYVGAPETPGRWLVISEYAAPKSVDAARAQLRMLDILAIAPRVLEVDPTHVHARVRSRARGGSQYGRRTATPQQSSPETAPEAAPSASGTARPAPTAPTRRLPHIKEGGLTFEVNFDDYLDTGIFLDHRVTRKLLREEAAGARSFLNLFAYTGTATCYAADAGVPETTTVDLSNTYLAWAERNMRLNGFTGPAHRFVRADVLSWVTEQRRGRARWDLIFCDPPTFSNSSKMGRRSFDVQRDHVELLIGISRLLTREGEAVFSCNLRSFKPDLAALARAGVVLEDVTAQTIPDDFARNPRIHRCYLMWRTTPEEAQRRLNG